MSFGLMWNSVLLTVIVAFGLNLTFRLPKEHCVCGVRIPEGGGKCECGEYNGRMVIKIDRQKVFEDELKRIEEEKRKGNSYDTFL